MSIVISFLSITVEYYNTTIPSCDLHNYHNFELFFPSDVESVLLDLLAMGWDGGGVYLFSFALVSNSISLLLAWSFISSNVLCRLLDTNYLISVLSMLKYQYICTHFEDECFGKNMTLSVNILVISVTDSMVCFSDKYL